MVVFWKCCHGSIGSEMNLDIPHINNLTIFPVLFMVFVFLEWIQWIIITILKTLFLVCFLLVMEERWWKWEFPWWGSYYFFSWIYSSSSCWKWGCHCELIWHGCIIPTDTTIQVQLKAAILDADFQSKQDFPTWKIISVSFLLPTFSLMS